MNADVRFYNQISERVIGYAFTVSNSLGAGFLEKVYVNPFAHELRKAVLDVQLQASVKVTYDDVVVGAYVADVIVTGVVLVEVKAFRALDRNPVPQCMNYLAATALKRCLLLNFGSPRVAVKRIVRDFWSPCA